MTNDATTWLTPLAALAGGVATALIAGYATNRVGWSRAKVDITTAGRQRWMDALRDDLADLIAARIELNATDKPGAATANSVRRLRARVMMRMDEHHKRNRTNPHIALAAAVRRLRSDTGPIGEDVVEEVIRTGQEVIDAAWSQVKAMK